MNPKMVVKPHKKCRLKIKSQRISKKIKIRRARKNKLTKEVKYFLVNIMKKVINQSNCKSMIEELKSPE